MDDLHQGPRRNVGVVPLEEADFSRPPPLIPIPHPEEVDFRRPPPPVPIPRPEEVDFRRPPPPVPILHPERQGGPSLTRGFNFAIPPPFAPVNVHGQRPAIRGAPRTAGFNFSLPPLCQQPVGGQEVAVAQAQQEVSAEVCQAQEVAQTQELVADAQTQEVAAAGGACSTETNSNGHRTAPLRRSTRQAAAAAALHSARQTPSPSSLECLEDFTIEGDEEEEVLPMPPRRRCRVLTIPEEEEEDDPETEGRDELGLWMDGDDPPAKKRKIRNVPNSKKDVTGRKVVNGIHKSLSLKKSGTTMRKDPEPTARAHQQPAYDTIVITSDSESDGEVPAAEDFSQEEAGVPVYSTSSNNYVISPMTLPEDWCSVCYNDYEEGDSDLGHLGILVPCGCCRFCYICAMRVYHSQTPNCPRCRTHVVQVISQPFTKDLLEENNFFE